MDKNETGFEGTEAVAAESGVTGTAARKPMPALVRLSDRYKSVELQVAGVNMDKGGLKKVRRFVRDYGVTYPVLSGAGRIVMTQMVGKLPTTFLVYKQGRLAVVF